MYFVAIALFLVGGFLGAFVDDTAAGIAFGAGAVLGVAGLLFGAFPSGGDG